MSIHLRLGRGGACISVLLLVFCVSFESSCSKGLWSCVRSSCRKSVGNRRVGWRVLKGL